MSLIQARTGTIRANNARHEESGGKVTVTFNPEIRADYLIAKMEANAIRKGKPMSAKHRASMRRIILQGITKLSEEN
jgi:hypothetical protein